MVDKNIILSENNKKKFYIIKQIEIVDNNIKCCLKDIYETQIVKYKSIVYRGNNNFNQTKIRDEVNKSLGWHIFRLKNLYLEKETLENYLLRLEGKYWKRKFLKILSIFFIVFSFIIFICISILLAFIFLNLLPFIVIFLIFIFVINKLRFFT